MVEERKVVLKLKIRVLFQYISKEKDS